MSYPVASRRPGAGAFTLVELLVTIGVIALLIAILLPVLGRARREANRAYCLNNIRNMQLAQMQYCNDNGGYLVQAGLSHAGVGASETVAWINTLQRYYRGSNTDSDTRTSTAITVRCPADNSPHWPGGIAVPGTNPPAFRRTSFGINSFLDRDLCPWGPGQSMFTPAGGWYPRITKIRRPAATIQFIEMAYTGPFAASDHPHIENWVGGNPVAVAAGQLQISAHGGQRASWDAMANYGFLDGHAESLRFREVFSDLTKFNRFDPALAR